MNLEVFQFLGACSNGDLQSVKEIFNNFNVSTTLKLEGLGLATENAREAIVVYITTHHTDDSDQNMKVFNYKYIKHKRERQVSSKHEKLRLTIKRKINTRRVITNLAIHEHNYYIFVSEILG